MKNYPSDLTDRQYKKIAHLFTRMRKYKWSKRILTNAVFYVLENGCQWRQLPHVFSQYQTVYSFFRRAKETDLWEKLCSIL